MENIQQKDQLHSVSATTSHSPSKAFIILIVVLLIVIVGLGGYIMGAKQNKIVQTQTQPATPILQSSPTPLPPKASGTEGVDDTANWKTHVNTKHGYSFRYPSNWLILSPGGQYGDKCVNSTDKDDIIELSQKNLDYCGFVGEQLPNSKAEFTIWVLDEPWEEKEILTTDATGTDISENIVVVGERATKTPFTEKSYLPNIQATRIYFNHSGKGYLMFLKQTDKKGNYDPVYDQILSTFRFD